MEVVLVYFNVLFQNALDGMRKTMENTGQNS